MKKRKNFEYAKLWFTCVVKQTQNTYSCRENDESLARSHRCGYSRSLVRYLKIDPRLLDICTLWLSRMMNFSEWTENGKEPETTDELSDQTFTIFDNMFTFSSPHLKYTMSRINQPMNSQDEDIKNFHWLSLATSRLEAMFVSTQLTCSLHGGELSMTMSLHWGLTAQWKDTIQSRSSAVYLWYM